MRQNKGQHTREARAGALEPEVAPLPHEQFLREYQGHLGHPNLCGVGMGVPVGVSRKDRALFLPSLEQSLGPVVHPASSLEKTGWRFVDTALALCVPGSSRHTAA